MKIKEIQINFDQKLYVQIIELELVQIQRIDFWFVDNSWQIETVWTDKSIPQIFRNVDWKASWYGRSNPEDRIHIWPLIYPLRYSDRIHICLYTSVITY